ncbi:hypothetical protein R3W88_002941 [Solanum pinnatisectum]|uniref:linoleate 9S-lipoxygenase n=1 Tax=Solanum pinnatisectum TaxID=50273 RepID=A0AAV9MQA1_9SOLN|nr:hypothetical protein R3W88_002941 [Solanum pinnatisectum]
MFLSKIVDAITGKNDRKKVKGTVVLMKKNVLDFTDIKASVVDEVVEFLGKKVSFQLISSSVHDDPENGLQGKLSNPAYLENWLTHITPIIAGESTFSVTFEWDHEEFGVPGAFIINNFHLNEFFLKSLTLEHVPNHGKIHFICNSWIYPASKYKSDRIFFANQAYLPSDTPEPLRKYRENELVTLRGDGTGKLEEWDRVYDYAYYNDLGDPDKGKEYDRPVLGGSSEYPYPRRGRTGREPTKTDPNSESRISSLMSLDIYVPRDERFGHVKMSDFLTFFFKSIMQTLLPGFEGLFDNTPNEFDSFEDVLKLYEGGIKLPVGPWLKAIIDSIPSEILKDILQTDGQGLLKYPTPQVIQEDKSAWRTDEEFGRETLAGTNPVLISRLQEFPPKSNLDPSIYGNQNSTITREQIENKLDGLTVDEAIKTNRLFILNHHDIVMPLLRRINTSTNTKTYASRTLLFLQDTETLKPVAIELSLPHPNGDQFGAVSKVYTPSEQGVEGSIWQLAKAYATVNDSGTHQLISHWLNTHAVMEPIVIATNRQLSVLHPIHKLQTLINGDGFIEKFLFPAKYSMEMSSVAYKDWVFHEQALPADLIKRGMAVEDSISPFGIRLLIQDYPYAVDGLKIWSTIKIWVTEYCNFYYKSDDTVQKDNELQAWWKEICEEGHGDKKDEPWWPKMQTLQELIDSCTIIIWIASALHAAVNFGNYSYGGYLVNRPSLSRKFMPEPGSAEYEELKINPDKVFLKTVVPQQLTLLGMSVLELLSRHASDTLYLGQNDSPEWTKDQEPLLAFERFGKKLSDIENQIIQMNGDHKKWKNRSGPVKVPYTLLFPTSEEGLSGRGIPNSVSI